MHPDHRQHRSALRLFVFLVVLSCLADIPTGTHPVDGAAPAGDGDVVLPWAANQLVIRIVPGPDLDAGHFVSRNTGALTGDPSLDILCTRYGLTGAVEGTPGGRVFLLSFSEGAPDPRALQSAFLTSGLVSAAEPNLVFHSFASLPNDPFYASSGTWKQPYPDLWGLLAVAADEAWARSEATSDVVIGLVDSGLDFGHPDVGAGVWRNQGEVPDNGLDDDGNGFTDDVWGYDFTLPDGSPGSGRPLDVHGHGTNAFGIISATWDNGFGIPGLAFNCRTMVVKGLGDDGSGTLFDLTRAIHYAVDNGAHVLSLGWGAFGQSDLLEETIRWAESAGVVIVCAAGNTGQAVSDVIPAAYLETLAVGASEPGGGILPLSNHGPALDLVAPGVDILTTRAAFSDPAGDGSRFVGNDFFRSSGTSSAAPHVAAAAGLLLAHRESISADAVRTALRAAAVPPAESPGITANGGYGQLHTGNLLALEHPVGVRLTSPRRGEILFGDLPLVVAGRLSEKTPFLWRLSWGAGEFPDRFNTLADSDDAVHGLVTVEAALPTAGFEPGIYTVRLQAWHPATLTVYEERVNLLIDNSRGLLSGQVLSSGSGGPLPAVEVFAFEADTLDLAGSVLTGANGEFRFSQGLPAGWYFVRAGSGFTDVIPEYFDGAASISGAEAVEIVAGTETAGIDFSLARRGMISGTITRRGGGEPVAGATVSIYYPAGTLMRETVSGTDGGYRFTNLIEQYYFIGAAHPEQRFVPRFFDDRPTIDQATPVNVQNDTEAGGVDLALKRHGGAIGGTVRRESDGQGLPGIAVQAAGLGNSFHRGALSGEGGSYLLGNLPSGVYRVFAAGDAGGYRRQYYPEVDSPLEGELLALTGDQELSLVDFSLRRAFFIDISDESPGLTSPLESAVYGLCWRDFDDDGDPDLFAVPASGRCRLLRNEPGRGGLIDDTLESGAAAGGLKTAVSAADQDNDGLPELHLPRYGPFGSPFPDVLLRTGADGRYRDAAVELGLVNPPEGIDSCWADFDANGFADLFVVNLFQPDALFFNTGDGRFREAAAEAGVAGAVDEASAAAAPCDMDGDGLTDLLVVVDEFAGSPRKNHLYRNLGNGRFEDVAQTAGLHLLSRSLCAAWGDADNDGDPDLFIGGVNSDTLLRNEGAGIFTDVTAGSGLDAPHTARGVCWVDADLDGLLDLFILRSGDAGCRLLLGDGEFSFRNVSIDAGLAESGQWTAFAWADHDLDGDPDLALADAAGRIRLLRNDLARQADGGGPAWVAVDLEGRAAPRDGLDTVLTVETGGRTIVRHSGDLHGPRSRGDRRLLIGLGPDAGDQARAVIRWPSGTIQTVDPLPVNQLVRIVEAVPPTWIVAGTGLAAANPARIRCYLPAGREVTAARIRPFGSERYGVETACGDLDGDGVDEIVAGPGPGPSLAPQIRAFDATGGPLPGGSLLAFSHGGYGAVISCGDLDGDGIDELAASPGPGPSYGPAVALYRYRPGEEQWGRVAEIPVFFAYGSSVRGGTRSAFGDLDGDGLDELVTAPGPLAANGAHIRGWRLSGDGATPLDQVNFLAYPPGTGHGAVVACGDLDGDGRDELVTAPGPGPGHGPHIKVWRIGESGEGMVLVTEMLAALPGNRGARIACGDLDGDGREELVAAAGPDPDAPSLIRAWRLEEHRMIRLDGVAFHAYQQYGGGVSLAVGSFEEPSGILEK